MVFGEKQHEPSAYSPDSLSEISTAKKREPPSWVVLAIYHDRAGYIDFRYISFGKWKQFPIVFANRFVTKAVTN